MFGEKETITIKISKDILEKSKEIFKNNNLDVDTGINLILKKILEEEYLLKECILDYKENYKKRAKEHLLNELNKGVKSFDEIEIRGIDILEFLGVGYG